MLHSRRIAALLAAALAIAGCAGSASRNEVHVAATENGFVPASVTVPVGRPATLVITRRTDATCATEAVFVETGRTYPLPLNQPVRIELATASADTLHFACGMNMFKGQVLIR